jgi:hypothetical protein
VSVLPVTFRGIHSGRKRGGVSGRGDCVCGGVTGVTCNVGGRGGMTGSAGRGTGASVITIDVACGGVGCKCGGA